MLLLAVSFLAGVLTILAPCVLPVLPVIIGGSVGATTREKLRPYIIAAALAASIITFTLLLKVSTLFVNISPALLTAFSGGLIVLLGIAAVVPEMWEKFVITLNWQAASQQWLGQGERNPNRYVGAILVGVALGPVFASCSPTYAFILASVLPRNFLAGALYLALYSLGLVLTLLAASLAGRRYIKRFSWAIDTHSWFRRGIGVLFIAIGVVIISGNQLKVETWVADHLPFDESHIEQTLLSTDSRSIASTTSSDVFNVVPSPAPEFEGLTSWINSPALTMQKLHGKVVLVDFWTYSCINCLRTLPYLERWYQTYQKDGFVIVGVNTPEFAFEHSSANVAAAVKQHGITYPVALDNDYATWDAYQNNSWPADYLVDQDGNIRYVALGEGDYDKTETAIQALLGVNQKLQTPAYAVPITQNQTPETYFGAERRSDFSGSVASRPNKDGSYAYSPTSVSKLEQNAWTLSGNWKTAAQYITPTSSGAKLSFNVAAKDVYVVATGSGQKASVQLSGGGAGQFGADDPNGTLVIGASRLYHVASFPAFSQVIVTLTVPAGVSLYTFTFGS